MPGIILIHGGSFRFGSKTTDRMPDLADYFASRGYIAVSINYRLRGDNPDGNNAALWAASDASQAFQWMVENSIEGGLTEGLMVDKIAIGGGSAGAITSLVMAHSNFPLTQPKAVLNFWGSYTTNRSVADENDPPVFTVHGTADRIVSIAFAQIVANECREHGIPYKLISVAGGGHVLWDEVFNHNYAGQKIIDHAADFLYQHLGLGTVPETRLDTLQAGEIEIEKEEGFLSLYWRVQDNMLYDLRASENLKTPLQDWAIYEDPSKLEDLRSGGNGTMVLRTPMQSNKGFLSVKEKKSLGQLYDQSKGGL